jgi:hypothetical protein
MWKRKEEKGREGIKHNDPVSAANIYGMWSIKKLGMPLSR